MSSFPRRTPRTPQCTRDARTGPTRTARVSGLTRCMNLQGAAKPRAYSSSTCPDRAAGSSGRRYRSDRDAGAYQFLRLLSQRRLVRRTGHRGRLPRGERRVFRRRGLRSRGEVLGGLPREVRGRARVGRHRRARRRKRSVRLLLSDGVHLPAGPRHRVLCATCGLGEARGMRRLRPGRWSGDSAVVSMRR